MSNNRSSILEQWKKQMEADKMQEALEKPTSFGGFGGEDREFVENGDLTEDERRQVMDKVREIREDPNDPMNQFKQYKEMYPDLNEVALSERGCLKTEEVKPVMKRAYCPKCGHEIVSTTPVMFNPYLGVKICRYDCPKCGAKYNLEYSYPRVAYVNSQGEEVNAFGQ